MSSLADILLETTACFEKDSLLVLEKIADKHSKVDSKAKVRNRGKVVFPAESANVKDKKDHFPINDADQARNALARAGQYSSVPSWYKGSLESLKSAIQRAVHKHYPSIGKEKEKKSALTVREGLLNKYSHNFEAPRIIVLRNMKDAEPNEADKKEIQEWIEEEEKEIEKRRKQKK